MMVCARGPSVRGEKWLPSLAPHVTGSDWERMRTRMRTRMRGRVSGRRGDFGVT